MSVFSTVKLKERLTKSIDDFVGTSNQYSSRASFVAEACENFLKIQQSDVTDEERKYIERTIERVIRDNCVGRKIFSTEYLPDSGCFEGNLPIPIIHKDFTLPWKDIHSSRMENELINVEAVEEACLQVCMEEDKLLLTGEHKDWPALGIEGLATATGRSVIVSAGEWSKIFPKNFLLDLKYATDRLKDKDHVPPYTLIVPLSFMDIWRREMLRVVDDVCALDGVYASKNLFSADGGLDTALVVKLGKDNFEVVVAQEMSVHTWTGKYKQDKKDFIDDGNFYGKVHEALVPRINDPTSICEIRNIS